MKSNRNGSENQAGFDPETGEIMPDADATNGTAEDLFGKEGRQPDGTIILPKITMASVQANPERAKMNNRPMKMALVTGIAGNEFLMPKMGDEQRLADLGPDHPEYKIFCALVAAVEPWGCVTFDDAAEPHAVYKSDYLFLPVYHVAVLNKMRQVGPVAIALELWAKPSSNPRGYSWHVVNLAKYDRNISPIDRMLQLGIAAGRAVEDRRGEVGLLADLRRSGR